MDIEVSLLREKFIINETGDDLDENALHIEAPGTRIPLRLQAGDGDPEKIVIRAHNMHSCARLSALVIQEYEKRGPIVNRDVPVDWFELWDSALSNYERTYQADRWVAVYSGGKKMYSTGEYHPFLDVIEKCQAVSKGDYEGSIKMAENAFMQAGKEIKIDYDGNVALVAHLSRKSGRCSMVLREPDRTTTFNYTVTPQEENIKLKVGAALSTAADFLEGVQLSYIVGENSEKMDQGIIEKYSDEERQVKQGRKRITELDAQINALENMCKIRYRPERPDFNLIIQMAEKKTRENLLDTDDEYIE